MLTPESETKAQEPISKSQMKRLLKRQKWLEGRGERRKQEREKRKIKRREAAQKRDQAGETGVIKPRTKLMSESENKFRVVIDMDFEDYMTEHEISKAILQVGRIYAINRHSENPCQLYISSLKNRILEKMNTTNVGYKNWDINYSDKSYLDLFKGEGADETSENASLKRNIIYLSGDSHTNLPEVEDLLKDTSKIYVIGGLVDHNRHKNLCQTRAQELNIQTAKLPIKEHIKLSRRHILSTVAVFEVLLKVLGDKMNWNDALKTGIPKRMIASTTDSEDG